MLLLLLAMFLVSFIVTAVTVPFLIRYCKERKIGGNDVHKKGRPFVPGLGGIAISLGILFSLFLAFLVFSSEGLSLFFDSFTSHRLADVALYSILIVLITAAIGLVDDFFSIPHKIKLLLPLLIAVPIIILKSSWLHVFTIPLIGPVPIPISVYLLLLIPIGVMAVTNVANTFAGYNGLEAGLAAIVSFFFLLIGLANNLPVVILLSIPLLASSIAFLFYNWYPARIFIDDVGTLVIGAVYSEIVILGGIEAAGFILLLLYISDFLFFKVPNNLPTTRWWGTYRNGKLYHEGKSVHLGQFVLSKFNGLREHELVLIFLAIQFVLGIIALYLSFG
ncbi:MAG: hypothetical protein N3G74_02660 [Candidatus Micrarchaeota archaeon]|nr:hypothetical protein [Candidatus Micrarchaeota archaeon]